MYCVMIWSSSYGIIPALIFGFAGWTRKIQKYISTMCITDTSTSNNSSSNSSNSNSNNVMYIVNYTLFCIYIVLILCYSVVYIVYICI